MKRAARTVFTLCLCAAIIVGFYIYLDRAAGNRVSEDQEQSAVLTEEQRLAQVDFEKNYPPTPREVIKWYNRYSKVCFGSEKPSKSETKKYASKLYELLDDEIRQSTSEEAYADSLWNEVADFTQRKARINETEVCDTSDVIYRTIKKKEYAYVQAAYYIREATSYTRTYQKFVLRQDKDGNWKILGFVRTDADGNPKETN